MRKESVIKSGIGLERVVAVDWSGRVDAAGQRRHIWAGVWTSGTLAGGKDTVTLEAGRTREELIAWLIEMARETPRMVVGIDCCFSYPAWFLKEHHCSTVFDFWQHVASGHGERWLARECDQIDSNKRDERFWGKPYKRPAQFCGQHLHRSMRLTDMDNKITPKMLQSEPIRAAAVRGITPKSPFQIGGSGSVGTGSLRAIPHLVHLHEAGFCVWPFESAALTTAKPAPLLVEMYTRLLTGPVAKSNPTARKTYLTTRRRTDPTYAKLTPAIMNKALNSQDAFDALVSAMEMRNHQHQFVTLKKTKDPTLQLEGITWRPDVQQNHP